MNFVFKLAKYFKIFIRFLGNMLLSFFAWTSCIFGYLPFVFMVYIIDFGIDYHKLPNVKQFIVIYKNGVKSILFLKESLVRKLGYYFVLPLLKSSKEDENPVASMFSKYFNAKLNNQNLQIAHEYIDSMHRKNTYFTAITFLGLAFVYAIFTTAIIELTELLGLVGGLTAATGLLDMTNITRPAQMGYGFTVLSPLFFGITAITWIISTILEFIIVMLTLNIFLLIYWGFKEIKTQKHLNEYIDENLNLIVATLENNFLENQEILEKIKEVRIAVLASADPMSEDDIFQIPQEVNNFKRLI